MVILHLFSVNRGAMKGQSAPLEGIAREPSRRDFKNVKVILLWKLEDLAGGESECAEWTKVVKQARFPFRGVGFVFYVV